MLRVPPAFLEVQTSLILVHIPIHIILQATAMSCLQAILLFHRRCQWSIPTVCLRRLCQRVSQRKKIGIGGDDGKVAIARKGVTADEEGVGVAVVAEVEAANIVETVIGNVVIAVGRKGIVIEVLNIIAVEP